MKMWALAQSRPYEGEEFLGIYASRSAAVDAAKRLPDGLPENFYCTIEVTVDAPPSGRMLVWEDVRDDA